MLMQDHRHLGREIKMISNLIKRNVNPSLELPELTRAQGWIIGFIRMRDENGLETFQKDIEKAYEIRRSTATGILHLLEKNGYLKKQSVVEDARLKKLVLTSKAIAVNDKIIAKIEAFEAKLAEGISEEEMEVFYRVIDKMKENLNKT